MKYIIFAMQKYIVPLLLLFGCMLEQNRSCEFCGEWRYSGFEYANRITADCQGMSHDFENTIMTIGKNFFNHTYSIDNTPTQISDVDIIKVPVDEYENAPAILISKDNKIMQKLYITASDKVYIYLDGCRFYFNRMI